MKIFIELLLVFSLSLFLIRLAKHYAPALGFMDIPNSRSSHETHTPRAGGIGFFLAIVIILPFFHLSMLLQHAWTFLAIFIVFLVGVLDDHRSVPPSSKIVVLVIATVFLSFDGLLIDHLGKYFTIPVALGWFALPFTVFAVTSFTNAFNLIDGIDGLAAVICIVILSSFLVIGYQNHDTFMITLSSMFILALAAFLIFNWHPASIFMGDSGSLTLGFVISVLALKSLAYIPTVSILFLTALPIFDTIIVMIRRKRKGRSIFAPDRCHICHIAKYLFMKDIKKAVFFLGALQAFYSITGLLLIDRDIDGGYLLILFISNIVFFYFAQQAMIKHQKLDCYE